MKKSNLFDSLPASLPSELVTELVAASSLRIERIVSTGQFTPEDQWYDQEHAEWVVVLSGAAKIRFADDQVELDLSPGDYLDIPPHCRHRVTWTSPTEATVWLAIHYQPA